MAWRWVMVVGGVVVLAGGGTAAGAEYLVRSAAEVAAVQGVVRGGDVIVLADGVWTNQNVTVSANGSTAAGVTVRAQTPGRVVLTGSSRLTVSGDHVTVSGLVFRDGALTGGQIISLTSAASFSRVTECAIIDYDPPDRNTDYEWVRVDGVQNRVDHNYFKGKDHAGITLEVAPVVGARHRIDNNHFVDRPRGNGNGWETIRVGLSGTQTRAAEVLIERNLFERCDGELEIISNKTSNNVIRNNTIRASDGTITLRHGQGSRVEGNFILGENKSGSGGIRVIGPNHVVVNNYMADLDTNALSITTGYSDWDVATTATGYEPVYNVLIAHNTVVGVTDQVVTRDAGYSSSPTSTRNVRPRNVTMANNLFYATTETLIQGTEGAGWVWAGNIASGANVGKSGSGILNVNPRLVKGVDGVWRPDVSSPAIDAGTSGGWGVVTTDIDGQGRVAPVDIGADEVGGVGPTANRPLYGGDVGPGWLKRRVGGGAGYGVPVILFEAEDFTAVRDPNGDGATWGVVERTGVSGGKVIKAPGGARTDLTSGGGGQEAVVEYDLAIYDPGTYYLYGLVRGEDSGSNSLYSPAVLGAAPTVNETLPEDGRWAWVELASYVVAAGEQGRAVTLQIGRRERDVEVDRFVLSPVKLSLVVPEAGGGVVACGLLVLGRRRRG